MVLERSRGVGPGTIFKCSGSPRITSVSQHRRCCEEPIGVTVRLRGPVGRGATITELDPRLLPPGVPPSLSITEVSLTFRSIRVSCKHQFERCEDPLFTLTPPPPHPTPPSPRTPPSLTRGATVMVQCHPSGRTWLDLLTMVSVRTERTARSAGKILAVLTENR